MADVLNLFPARVAIGRTADGGPVYLTLEFGRALDGVLQRIGGPVGVGLADVAVESAQAAPVAWLAQLAAEVRDLAHRDHEADRLRAEVAELRKLVEGLLESVPAVAPTDWEHPGKLGASSPNSAKVTDISYTGKLTGGTGVVALGVNQIYKNAAGNVCVGGTNPGAKLDVRGQVRAGLDGFQVADGGAAIFSLAYSGGVNLDRVPGTNFKILLNGSAQTKWDAAGGMAHTGAFGCNGANPQGPYALGGAATDLATTTALANKLRAMAIANGMAS